MRVKQINISPYSDFSKKFGYALNSLLKKMPETGESVAQALLHNELDTDYLSITGKNGNPRHYAMVKAQGVFAAINLDGKIRLQKKPFFTSTNSAVRIIQDFLEKLQPTGLIDGAREYEKRTGENYSYLKTCKTIGGKEVKFAVSGFRKGASANISSVSENMLKELPPEEKTHLDTIF